MTSAAVDRWFARFRSSGDAAALAAVFDATAPELLRVARHLAGDVHAAEDLVQATFVKAIERRERHDPGLPVLPWLLGILANLARHERRQARRAPPAIVAGEQAAADEIAADAETAARLHEALRALPQPYREVLLLQVEHGLDSGQIAEVTGRKAATVRTQIARGMELLRGALPVVAGVGVAAVVLPGRGLAAVRGAVLRSVPAAGAGAGSIAAAGLLGGITMKKGLLAFAALVVLALFSGWWLSDHGDAAAPPRSDAGAIASAGAAPDAAVASAADGAARAAPREAATATATASEVGALRVVVRHADGAAASGIGLYVAGDRLVPFGREATTDAGGVATFVDLPVGAVAVKPDRGPATSFVVAGGANELELRLPEGVDVIGVVRDARGEAAIPHAVVFATSREHHDRAQRLVQADAEGAFTLRAVPAGTHLFARAAGWQPGDAKRETVAVGAKSPLRVELRVGARGFALRGRVTCADGAPAAFARVAIAVDEDADRFVDGLRERSSGMQRQRDVDAFLLRADANGEFASDEVPEGEALVFARAAAGQVAGLAFAPVMVAPGPDNRCDVVLQPGAEVFGTVRDEAGKPFANLPLVVEWKGTDRIRPEGAFGPLLTCIATTTDADGNYRLRGLLAGDHRLLPQARLGADLQLAQHGDQRESLSLLAAEVRRFDFVAQRSGDLAVRLLGPEGAPLAGWGVWVGAERAPTPRMQTLEAQRTGSDGRVRVPGLPRGEPLCVSVFAPRPREAGDRLVDRFASRQWFDVPVRDDELVLQLTAGELPTGAIRARLVDGSRAPYALRNGRLWREGWSEQRKVVAASDGSVAIEALPAGRYWLEGSGGGSPMLGPFDVVAGERTDAGEVAVPEPGGLRVVVRGADGGAVVDPRAELRGDHPSGQRRHHSLRLHDGVLAAQGRPPGAYRLVVHADGFAPSSRDVEIRAGVQATVEVVLPRGFAQPLRVDPALGPLRPANHGGWLVDCDVFDAGMAHVGSVQPTSMPFPLQLTRGTWTVRWNLPGGARTSTTFTLGDAPSPPIVLRPE